MQGLAVDVAQTLFSYTMEVKLFEDSRKLSKDAQPNICLPEMTMLPKTIEVLTHVKQATNVTKLLIDAIPK